MKLKYQQGGALSLPFAVYQPMVLPNETASSSANAKSSKKGTELTDLMDKILGNLEGLPGDRQAILGNLASIFDNIERKMNSQDLFGGTGSIATDYLKALNYVGNLKFQHDEFLKARDTAISKGSLHEVAINSSGQIMAATSDGFEWITPEQFSENQDSYRPITNSELLTLRAQGVGGLAFDQASIATVTNSMGIAEVTKLIQDSIQNLGNTSNSNSSYIGVKTGDLMQGLQDYTAALQKSGRYDATVQDLYEVKLLTETQADQAKSALQYIYNTLPTTARALLKMKSNGKDSGAEALIGTLVHSNLKYKSEFNPNLVGGPSAKKSGKTGEGTDNDKSNPYLQLIREEGGQPRTFTIVPEDTNNGLQVTGTFYSALPNVNDEMSIEALLKTGMLPITGDSRKNISFGDQLIDPSNLKDVMFDNEGGAVMTLPIMKDQLGNIRVNMSLVEDFNEVQNTLKKYKTLSEKDYMKKYAELLKEKELDELIDPATGLPDLSKTGQFLVIGAYTTDKIEFNKKSKFIKKVLHPSEDLEKRLIRGLSTNEDRNDYSIDVDDWGLIEGFYDDVYRANVFIPLNQNPNAAVNAQGDQRSESSVTAAEQNYQQFNKLKNMKPTYEVE